MIIQKGRYHGSDWSPGEAFFQPHRTTKVNTALYAIKKMTRRITLFPWFYINQFRSTTNNDSPKGKDTQLKQKDTDPTNSKAITTALDPSPTKMNTHGKQTSTIFPKRTKGTAPGKSWKSQVINLTASNSADAAPPINLEGYTTSAFNQIGSGALSYTAQDANCDKTLDLQVATLY
jgi:hypothetical protein